MSANFTPTLHEYTDLTPFRFWCQKILPLAYDDSLSYYELLCKVVDYLNKTMEDVTLSIEDVQNLHTAYVALQGYVNNYFNNLDVQEEINNKLDALVADGTIHSIFTPDVMAILNVAQQASLEAIADIPDEVTAWLAQHITQETGYVIDDTLTVSGAAADAKVTGDKIGALKSDFGDFIGIDTVNFKNDFVAGSSNVTSNVRYFYGDKIPEKTVLNSISVYIGTSNTSSSVTLEIWTVGDDGNTLTKVDEKTFTNVTANTWLDIPINEYSDKKRMFSFYKASCYIYTHSTGVVGTGILFTTDISSNTLSISDMTAYAALDYIVGYSYDYKKPLGLEGYGKRVTTTNYTQILTDLNNAIPNTIYDIFQCLHSIQNIPSSIPNTLTSATFYSVRGEVSSGNNWTVQFLIPNGTETKIYYRNHMDGSWKPWKEVSTTVQNANLLNLDYYNATCVNKAEIEIDSTKTILIFGDSITAGNTDTSWTYHFADMTGCTIVNKAVAGATYGESISGNWISTQISGVSSTEWENADYVIISAGTNDGVHNTPESELATKVQSAITAIKANTNVPIIVVTPIRRNTPTYSENLKLPYISGIITNIALSNECNVVCGYTFPIASETNGEITNLTRDGLHPNATGANVFARAMINALY